jgi:hypothetical protein
MSNINKIDTSSFICSRLIRNKFKLNYSQVKINGHNIPLKILVDEQNQKKIVIRKMKIKINLYILVQNLSKTLF